MIETEEQRRWWFATHPEYSWSRRGIRKEGGVDPEEVDRYVDEALKYETGPVADLLKSVKRNFGTEANSRELDERLAYLGELQRGSEKKSPSDEEGDQGEATFWDAVTKGIDNTLQDWQRWFGLSARLPPKGTAEYNKIKAARDKGVRLKQAQELKDIRSGGKGSGVWSEEELEAIRRTGNFPIDAEWHHDPTVANRPDLAADPRVVHPLRGGKKGHLRDGHNRNWQNPKK
jgi:hypothetical protein